MRRVLAALALAFGPPAAADDLAVDVALVLAVDVSLSMDPEEQRAQREGYAAALTDPAVLGAIGRGRLGRVAVAYLEWGGAWTQRLIAPWTVIAGAQDAEALAAELAVAPLTTSRGTAMGMGLTAAAALFADAPPADRRVIDVSGDGPNNLGGPVTAARDAALAAGIEINGLPLMLGAPDLVFSIPDLDLYYEDCVIGGPNAFALPVRAIEGFATAIRQKLVLEIAGLAPQRPDPARPVPAAGGMDCQIGEKLYEQWRRTQEWR